MKFMITLLLAVFIVNDASAQIPWNEKRPLTWKDFKGPPVDSSKHYANTKTSTNYQYHVHCHNHIFSLTFEVECVFLPNGSWCRPHKQTEALLRHEQLHFDIQEINARKLMAAFKAKTYSANFTEEVRMIYNSIAQEASIMQDKYDRQTRFSENIDEQLKWERLVREQLLK